MNETIRNSRAASNSGGDFKPSVRPSRPFVTAKEAKYVVVPLVLLGSQLVSSCGGGPGPGEATPIAMETPRPLSDLVKEQSQAGIPFQGYNTGESRKSDMFILNQSSTYGEFKGSTVMIGLDADNSQIASEMFAFEKGVFVVFYNAEGKALTEMSPVSINYGYDNNNNLSMIYKADLGNGEEGAENIVPFLTLTSNTSIDSLGADILAKAQAGDQETLTSLSQYFNDEGEVIALSYSNPQTHQQINVDNQSPNWGDKIKSVLAALNPFAATPAHAAPAEPNTQVVESTATTPPPGIPESVKTAIGSEYSEIQTGAVKGKDYMTGKDSDWTVEATSVNANTYNDANFSWVVTGEATDAGGQKFAVIWNEQGNYWFKSETINTDPNATNRTSFGEQLQGMVSNRDLYRMLLTQMDTLFPENTEKARFWLLPRLVGAKGHEDIIYQLTMSRADYNGNPDGKFQIDVGQEDYADIQNGKFTNGNQPYKFPTMIDGIATDLKNSQGQPIEDRPFSVMPLLVQNTDGKTMIWFGGLDEVQREDVLFGSASLDVSGNVVYDSRTVGSDGLNFLQRLIGGGNTMSLIIPPADDADWNNYGKDGWNNGGAHYSFGSINFANDAIIAMQDKPGVFFNLLPQSMQTRLIAASTDLKVNNFGVNMAVPFEGNALPKNVIDYLSTHIFETYYNDYGLK